MKRARVLDVSARADAIRALTDPTWREPLAWAVAIDHGEDPVAKLLPGERWTWIDPQAEVGLCLWSFFMMDRRFHLTSRIPDAGPMRITSIRSQVARLSTTTWAARPATLAVEGTIVERLRTVKIASWAEVLALRERHARHGR